MGGGRQGKTGSGRREAGQKLKWEVGCCTHLSPPGYDSLIEICTKSCFRELSVVFDHIHILGVNDFHSVGFDNFIVFIMSSILLSV